MAEALGAGCADWTHGPDPELNPPVSQVVKTGRRKVVEVADAVEEVESCSACYGYLIPALDRLKEERRSGKTGYEDMYRTGISGKDRNAWNRQLHQGVCFLSAGMSAY